jgi:hypothetical protein
MSAPTRKDPKVQEYLRALGNPYAASQIFGESEDAVVNDEYRLRGNPYAKLALESEAGSSLSPAPKPAPASRAIPSLLSLSKTVFRARAQRIFRQYTPPMEKGHLRPHHRDFIARNESCSPTKRYRLIRELEKYDISTIQGLIPQFNRERDALTMEKLRGIERAAEEEE